jgi:hypothetical protein
MNGMEAITRGTIAAVVPMEEPTTNLVKGMIATSNIMKGMERTAFITELSTLFSIGLSKICPLVVTWSNTPTGTPIMVAIIMDTATI